MNKKCYLVLFLTVASIYSCQQGNIEELYNTCYAQEVTVNGVSIKHYIDGFESELIKSKLLKDATGESYRDFFYEMSNYEYIVLNHRYSFLDSINGVEYDDVMKCPKKIANHKDISNSIFGKLAKHMKENNGDHTGFFESQETDSIFNERTFEYDYFKHKLFNIIKVYDKSKNQKGRILCKIEKCPEQKETL